MKFSKLKEIDQTLKIVFGDPDSIDLVRISSAIKPEKNTFIFIKNSRFLKDIGRLSTDKDYSQTGIIFEEKYFDTIKSSDEVEKLKSQFAFMGTIENLNYGMCTLSKPFYDALYGDLNYALDGRQVGNATVHVDAEISQNVFIGTNVKIGKGTKLFPGVVIMPEVEIGDNCIIYPNTTVYPYTKIGNNCRIHAGVVIGADGFGYNFIKGEHLKVWHLSGVIIEDQVEIGANSAVDAGAFIATKVGFGSKLDNFVMVGHNSQVGKHNVLACQAGFSGSSESGDYCAFGGGAGLAPGARVGKGCQFAARAIVSDNVIIGDGLVMGGHPARPLKEWLKSQAKIRQLIK